MLSALTLILIIGFCYWSFTILFSPKKKETFHERMKREREETRYKYYNEQEEYQKKREEEYRKKREKEDSYKKRDYNSFIQSCAIDMKSDFQNNPYVDKFDMNRPDYLFIYNFEDGRQISLSTDLKLQYRNNYSRETKATALQMSEAYLFMDLIKQMANFGIRRPGRSSRSSYRQNFYNDSYDSYSKRYTKPEPEQPKVNYTPEQLKYQELFKKLKEVNDRRMEQLNKMPKSHPDRVGLVNEVNVVKSKMKSAFEKSGLKMKGAL